MRNIKDIVEASVAVKKRLSGKKKLMFSCSIYSNMVILKVPYIDMSISETYKLRRNTNVTVRQLLIQCVASRTVVLHSDTTTQRLKMAATEPLVNMACIWWRLPASVADVPNMDLVWRPREELLDRVSLPRL